MMNRYELTYIIDTALEETARKELILSLIHISEPTRRS